MSHGSDGKPIQTKEQIDMRNWFNNVDGFGVVWYTDARTEFGEAQGPRPAMYKNNTPPTNDYNFHSICENVSSTCVMAHIRSATATPVTMINNHPFVFGRHTIMHNGVITNFVDIKRAMLELIDKDAYENIHGGTDSEHMAALYITFLTQGKNNGKAAWQEQYPVKEMAVALESTFKAIIFLQQKILGAAKAEANSLNVCCTDGQQLIACRFRNHATEQPPSLYWSDTAGVTLNRKYPDHPDAESNDAAYKAKEEHGKHYIAASEPSTYKEEEWNLIDKNTIAFMGVDGKPGMKKVDIEEEHMAQGVTTQHG